MRSMILSLAVLFAGTGLGTAQVVVNQTDTFEGGIANWQNPPGFASVQSGGPGGAADHFLQVQTNGQAGGSGSLLVTFNQNQWTGNYTTQGVSAIEMDLNNLNYPNGGAGMSIRIVFRTGTGGEATPAPVSNAFSLPSDGAWHHAVFPLNAANFTPINSPPSFATVLAGGNQDFRILHNPSVSEIGASTSPVSALLGIDNIHAMAVPEPGALALCGAAAVAALVRRSRRKDRE